MGRLVTSGFEWKALAVDTDFTSPDGGKFQAGLTVETSIVRSGAASAKASLGSNTSGIGQRFDIVGTSVGLTYFTRFGFYVGSRTAIAQADHIFRCTDASGNDLLNMAFSPSASTIGMYYGTGRTQIGATTSLSTGQWYVIEASVCITSGAGADDYIAYRVNGALVDKQTVTIGTAAPNRFMFGLINGLGVGGAATVYYDDVAVNDDVGAYEKSWPGPNRKIVLLTPFNDNARGGWTGGSGGTSNLAQGVDNLPPVGATDPGTDASQIRNAVSSATDNYDVNMNTFGLAGLISSDIVNYVRWWINHGTASATTPPTRHGQLIGNPAESAEQAMATPSAAVGAYPSNWIWDSGTHMYNPTVVISGTPPVLRVGKRTASTFVVDVDAMGIYAEYTPGWQTAPTLGGSLYDQMDETTASDTDYIYATAS